MSMKGQAHGHVSNGQKDGSHLDNGEDFAASWRPHAQGYSQPMSASAPINDPYSYYAPPAFPPYHQPPPPYTPGDHSGASWSNGDPSMTFLSGYGTQPGPLGHESYALDGMFGPSSFGGFGQPNFSYGYGNGDYPGPWGGMDRAKQFDYYREHLYGTQAGASVGSAPHGPAPPPAQASVPPPGTMPGAPPAGLSTTVPPSVPVPAQTPMDIERNVRSVDHAMSNLSLGPHGHSGVAPLSVSAPPISHPPPSMEKVDVGMKDKNVMGVVTSIPPPNLSHLPPTSVPPPPITSQPPPPVSVPKKTTWASIASQPAKLPLKGRKTHSSNSSPLPIGVGAWEAAGNKGKSGVIPPPPAVRPSAWSSRVPPPSQPPPVSPTSSSPVFPIPGGNAAAFPPPQAAVSPQAPPASAGNSVNVTPEKDERERSNSGQNSHLTPPDRALQVSPSFNPGQSYGRRPQLQHSPPEPSHANVAYSNGPVDEEEDLARPPILDTLKSRNNYNPRDFNLNPEGARFFVIKSYSEDDIHRSIKYEIWCSTEHGNKRLDEAFKEREGKGPIYLFFSVNGSGHFCGMAQMLSHVDYNSSASVWAQDKWKGQFKVKWIYVKDVPNGKLRHIKLENNENKPVTNSRDTQEIPLEKGKLVLREMHSFKHTTSIFDDFTHYEQRQMEEEVRRHHQPHNHVSKEDGQRGRRREDREGRDRDHREFKNDRENREYKADREGRDYKNDRDGRDYHRDERPQRDYRNERDNFRSNDQRDYRDRSYRDRDAYHERNGHGPIRSGR